MKGVDFYCSNKSVFSMMYDLLHDFLRMKLTDKISISQNNILLLVMCSCSTKG